MSAVYLFLMFCSLIFQLVMLLVRLVILFLFLTVGPSFGEASP